MLLTALGIVTFALVTVLAHVFICARRLERTLDSMRDQQADRLHRIERDVERVRQALDLVNTGSTTIDVRHATASSADVLPMTRDPGMRSTATVH